MSKSILSPDFTIPGQWSSPMPRSEIEAMLAVPVPSPDWDDLCGIAPDATGEMSSEEFVRSIREDWDRGRMGADDFRKPRPVTPEQIRNTM